MDAATRNEIADCLEGLASQPAWNHDAWQKCHDLVRGNLDNDVLAYVYDQLLYYAGLHSRKILGFPVETRTHQLEEFPQKLRNMAAALRSGLSLGEAMQQYNL